MPAKKQLVVFKVGTEEFAVDIMLTKEVVVMKEVTPVPETPDYVEGVMNLRGSLVPILDLRKRLRAGSRAAHTSKRIIIADFKGKLTGLIVDGANEVIRVSEEMIEPVPDIISEMGADYIAGVVNLGDRFITLIDLTRTLSEEITCELEEVLKVLPRITARTESPAQAV